MEATLNNVNELSLSSLDVSFCLRCTFCCEQQLALTALVEGEGQVEKLISSKAKLGLKMAQFEKAASVKLTRNAAKNCWKIPSSVVKHGKVCLPRISIYSLLFLAGQSVTEIKAPVFSSVSQGRGSSRSTHISAECSWRVDSLQKYTRVYSLWTACKNIHVCTVFVSFCFCSFFNWTAYNSCL